MTAKILPIVFLLIIAGLLVSLNEMGRAGQAIAETMTPTIEPTSLAAIMPVRTIVPLATPNATVVVEPMAATSPTSILPTAAWEWQPPGPVRIPVLLYHHVSDAQASRYFVSRHSFEAQLAHLERSGYTSIPISLLVDALLHGAELPHKPVVITFDDGYNDVVENAFTMMQRYNFTGTVYVITDQMGVKGYMDEQDLRSLVESGWEIGSHSRTHNNLRQSGTKLVSEIEGSRQVLEELLNVPVTTFSFPYGLTNRYITQMVEDAGYSGAVGLGQTSLHTQKSLFYLSRIEIRGDADLVEFALLVSGPGGGAVSDPLEFPLGP